MPKNRFHDPEEHAPLFDLAPAEAVAGNERQARPRSVGHASCPDCSNEKVGLIPLGTHLAYREHFRWTWSGARLQCRASLAAICVRPPRPVDGIASQASCKHLPQAFAHAERQA